MFLSSHSDYEKDYNVKIQQRETQGSIKMAHRVYFLHTIFKVTETLFHLEFILITDLQQKSKGKLECENFFKFT